jgi:hypothetical protein
VPQTTGLPQGPSRLGQSADRASMLCRPCGPAIVLDFPFWAPEGSGPSTKTPKAQSRYAK